MIVLFEIDELLKKVKRIHFIGIGGSGMCPLAEILHKEGYELSGSDNNETDTLARVRSLGIPVTLGQKAENIEGAELIVYTAAILPDNPELIAAKNSSIRPLNVPIFSAQSQGFIPTATACAEPTAKQRFRQCLRR